MLIESKYQRSERREMLQFITNQPETVLDVGCREGLFVKAIKEVYAIKDSWGVEPDDTIQEAAQANLDNVVIDFFTKETKLPEKYFDLIVFNDVLEHMYDPWEALEKARTLLSPKGIVIVSLPNIRNKYLLKKLIFNDDFEYLPAGILDVTHIRFFTKSTMVKMFKDTGFEVLQARPVVLIKKKRWYEPIKHIPRGIINFVTFNRFESLQYSQYAFTLKAKKA